MSIATAKTPFVRAASCLHIYTSAHKQITLTRTLLRTASSMVVKMSPGSVLLKELYTMSTSLWPDRKRDRETEKQRDRETERQRNRETERQRDRECVCVCVREGERDRERQRDRETER
jgi:hypothetical protein